MRRRSAPVGVLAVLLSASVSAASSIVTLVPPEGSAPQKQAAAAGNAAAARSHTEPTAAQLDQETAVIMPPPILRNTGKTVLTPDKPLLGRLNLHARPPAGTSAELPPELQPTPIEAANTGALAR